MGRSGAQRWVTGICSIFSVWQTKNSPSIRHSFTPGGHRGNRVLSPWIMLVVFKGRKKKKKKKKLQKTSCICRTDAPCACLSLECVFFCLLLLYFLHRGGPPGHLFLVLTRGPRHFPRPGRRAGCAAKWAADALSERKGRKEALTWEIPRRPVLREPRASWVEKKNRKKTWQGAREPS